MCLIVCMVLYSTISDYIFSDYNFYIFRNTLKYLNYSSVMKVNVIYNKNTYKRNKATINSIIQYIIH